MFFRFFWKGTNFVGTNNHNLGKNSLKSKELEKEKIRERIKENFIFCFKKRNL